jgi:hypothetical protein
MFALLHDVTDDSTGRLARNGAASPQAGSGLPLVGGFRAGSRFPAIGQLAMPKRPPDRNGAGASLRENGFF